MDQHMDGHMDGFKGPHVHVQAGKKRKKLNFCLFRIHSREGGNGLLHTIGIGMPVETEEKSKGITNCISKCISNVKKQARNKGTITSRP